MLFLLKRRHTPLYYTPRGGGTKGNSIFNVVLASLLLLTVSGVAAWSGGRGRRLRVRRGRPGAARRRAVAAAQRQARFLRRRLELHAVR